MMIMQSSASPIGRGRKKFAIACRLTATRQILRKDAGKMQKKAMMNSKTGQMKHANHKPNPRFWHPRTGAPELTKKGQDARSRQKKDALK